MKKEIRFCSPTGEYWFLSPYARFPIEMEVDGVRYKFPTVEHYYQSMKFLASDERFTEILNIEDPDEARLLTKKEKYKINRRPGFEKNKFDIMKDGYVARYTQNADAAKLLLSTGDALLIKSCEVCYRCGFGEGSGLNTAGKIQMQIRDELQKRSN